MSEFYSRSSQRARRTLLLKFGDIFFEMGDSDTDEVEYESERFYIGPYTFDITTVSFMPIEKLLELQSEDKEISGQKLWCGSLGVMEYMLNNPSFVNDTSAVVELGAGTGLFGMLAHKLGAANVILTDHDTRSLDHMKLDCPRNEVDALILRLDWFENDVSSIPLVDSNRISILAGDVLYKHHLLDPFFNIVHTLLACSTDGQMLLCHVPRAGVGHEHVIECAQSKGLIINRLHADTWRKGVCVQYSPADDYSRAELYLVKFKSPI